LVQIKPPLSIPQFDVLDELKNVYIKIPLLQAIKDIPIYTKAMKDICLKKLARKRIDPQTIHVIGHLAGLMTNTISMEKYVDPGIPKVTTIINNIQIPNTLIDLGAAINVMTLETMRTLQLINLQHTTIVLELADRSKVIPKGILEDIIVSLDSWEYPVDFLVLQPKSNLGGHPIILGRPWLATTDVVENVMNTAVGIVDMVVSMVGMIEDMYDKIESTVETVSIGVVIGFGAAMAWVHSMNFVHTFDHL
jgi:hypothetical protein